MIFKTFMISKKQQPTNQPTNQQQPTAATKQTNKTNKQTNSYKVAIVALSVPGIWR